MIFKKQIEQINEMIYSGAKEFFDWIARLLGYPEVRGMPILPSDFELREQLQQRDVLPKHITQIPPNQEAYPQNFLEALFGVFPYTMPIEKHFYEHEAEGYYNFYVENYRNMYFLPDWISAFLQIQLKVSVDHSGIEFARDLLFYMLLLYGFVLNIRTLLYWFIIINPYTYPWVFFVDLTDWLYDYLAGLLPCFLGIDLVPSFVMIIVGKLTDSLNHLVFTMPFLPSEGNPVKMVIDGDTKDVVQFHNLPYLWYKYPIPNDLREFWYFERPDIFKFMEQSYKQLGLEFRPLSVISQSSNLVTSVENIPILKDLNISSTQFICSNIFDYQHFWDFFTSTNI